LGTRIGTCSVPRDGGWRPGARWAREPSQQGESERTDGKYDFHHFRSNFPNDSKDPAKPLVTALRTGQKVIIAATCPAARALGLEPGMALAHARAMVPGLDVRDADPEGDAGLLARLALFAARRWTPRAAVSGEDGLWLDLTGVAHLFGGERAMALRILRFCARFGLEARIAIAGSYGAAHALARFGGEPLILCPSGSEAQAIAPLPIAALRIGDASAALRLGIDTIGDLIAMPRAPLTRRFGGQLLLRLDQALGRAGEGLDPILPEKPPDALVRFAEPIATAEAIEQALRHLASLLVARLEERGLGARRILLRCARIDGAEQRVAIGMARATRDCPHLLSLLCPKIETIEPGFGIEALHLVAARCEPLAPQSIDAGLSEEETERDLAPLLDRLAGRLGERSLFRLGAVESDVPERSVRRVPPLAETAPWPPEWPRPVRLLSRPEPVEQVVALLPDGPPRRFTWRGAVHVVRRADGPERIHGEWWKRAGEAQAVRDYFQVEDESGARFWLFRRGDGVDSRTGDLSWYLHGVFG
jgi:protein ImuB